MSFKLGQVIEDNEKVTWLTFKKSYFIFLSYCLLQMLALKTCNQDISKTITASSFNLVQLIEDNE